MPLLVQLILVLAVLGFCYWLFLRFVPVASPFREIIGAVIALAVILWLLDAVGWLHVGGAHRLFR